MLQGNEATATAVLATLEHCDSLQLGAHAQFDLDDAFASRLLLADGSSLTLAQWLPVLARHAPSRVVLSACETAVARVTTLPDEAIGFPTALVEHGVRSVVATLWPVEDVAAALVVAGYYQALAKSDVSHAEALRRAQHALRTLDVRTLMDRLAPMRDAHPRVAAVAARLRTRLRESPPEHRPFAESVVLGAVRARRRLNLMQELLAQLALVSTLLDNWDGIELRLPARSDALTARMATVAQSLAAARSPDEIAIALDDLLDLVLDTPAESFVRTLMERAAPPGRDDVRVRSQISALDVTQVASANEATRAGSEALARTVSRTPDPRVVPVFFATNRSIPDAGVSGVDAYSGNLAEHTSFGLAYVTIPVGHRRGRVETPRWWAPWIDKERPESSASSCARSNGSMRQRLQRGSRAPRARRRSTSSYSCTATT